MQKHFLVTISNEVENLFGVRFICSFFNTISEHQVTLLHICQQDSSDMNRTLNQMWKGPSDSTVGQLSAAARKSINKAKELLGQQRMAVDQVMTKTCAEKYGKVKDILAEGAHGLYDAIVLGKRASYALQWMFERPADEIVHAIIRDSGCTTPLWICPEPLPNRKNVLICLDGSENAYRTVDHVGYILAGQGHQKITLFHVETGTGAESAAIFSRAESLLHGHAINDDRISRKAARGLSVAGTIHSEIEKGSYAAVALGLHGETQGPAKKSLSLAGGITTKLISKAEKASLWCCP
jgi:hypothetical protein